MLFRRKTSSRRSKVRENMPTGRFSKIFPPINMKTINSILLCLLFVLLCIPIVTFRLILHARYLEILPIAAVIVEVCVAAAFYIHHYQKRIVTNHTRAIALIGVFILLLFISKLCIELTGHMAWAVGTSVLAAIILAIVYNQRFALGMSIIFSILNCFVATSVADIGLFLIMTAGVVVCCFSLKEIRTRMKLLEVGALTAFVVMFTSVVLGFWQQSIRTSTIFLNSGWYALAALIAALIIQSLLPIIEKTFGIATSMTLIDFSDMNNDLLKRLAMEAPGTFSHSLLVGSVAETAAESIGRNGLLCRVGAYYHDIGKINKPNYFVENELGISSRHKELSPAMSQLIIVGHVKDGTEMAKVYKLPVVLRQFIDTHHGTTLIEYFFHEAKKKQNSKNGKEGPPSESEFRYTGPRPKTKEAAIVMLADSSEGALRSTPDITPKKIETIIHNIAMKRLQDGQFDECELSLRELSQIEASMAKGQQEQAKEPGSEEQEQTQTSTSEQAGEKSE
ncbi:MAG: HDIG domain-containing metalloprotein [Planctomycetota bacterium]